MHNGGRNLHFTAAALASALILFTAVDAIAGPVAEGVAVSEQAGVAAMAKKLSDPKWLGSLKERLDGNIFLLIPSTVWVQARSHVVSSLLGKVAQACGLAINPTSARGHAADRFAFVVSVAPTESLADAVGSVYGVSPLPVLTPRSTLIKAAGPALEKDGIYVGSLDLDGLNAGMISIFDQSKLDTDNRDAIVDFAVFTALADTMPANDGATGGRFSYFLGGANLADMAGVGDDHIARLCVAAVVLEEVCHGRADGAGSNPELREDVNQVAAKYCAPNSALFMPIKKISNIVDRWANSLKH